MPAVDAGFVRESTAVNNTHPLPHRKTAGGCWRPAKGSAFNAHSGRRATAPRARNVGYWLALLAGGSDTRPEHDQRHRGATTHHVGHTRSNATVLHGPAFPLCPLGHESPQRKRAAPTIPPCETPPKRRTSALSRRHPKPPPLLALWLPYGPQEPTKRPKAPCPMSADSGRRSGAVLKPGGCGAGQAMFSGCE